MKKYDEFDDPKGGDFLGSVGPKAAFFIVLIALSFMIGVVWKLYAGGNGGEGQNVPIVRAELEPYKVVPDDPGGMKMPHKDSTIFSSLNSDPDADNTIENLLAEEDDESPLPRSQLFAGLNTERNPDLHAEAQETPLDQPLTEGEERIISQVKEAEKVVTSLVEGGADTIASADEVVKSVSEPVAELVAEIPPKVEVKIPEPEVEIIKVEVKPEVKPEPKPAPKPTPIKKVEPVVKAPAPVTKAVMGSGNYYVQLASVRDATRADGEWKKLKAKYSSALSGYDYRVETADLGAKGIYYRIQAGPVSKVQADQACNAIKKKTPGGCLVKKK